MNTHQGGNNGVEGSGFEVPGPFQSLKAMTAPPGLSGCRGAGVPGHHHQRQDRTLGRVPAH